MRQHKTARQVQATLSGFAKSDKQRRRARVRGGPPTGQRERAGIVPHRSTVINAIESW